MEEIIKAGNALTEYNGYRQLGTDDAWRLKDAIKHIQVAAFMADRQELTADFGEQLNLLADYYITIGLNGDGYTQQQYSDGVYLLHEIGIMWDSIEDNSLYYNFKNYVDRLNPNS